MQMQATLGSNVRLDQPLEYLDNLWALYDAVFDSLSDADWRRRHGKDWVVADLPYHLYYFDRELVLAPLRRGCEVPAEVVRGAPRTERELNAWNQRLFAERPADETPERSVARWREVRQELRAIVDRMDSDALQQPIFVPIMGAGWVSVGVTLGVDVAHHWNHFTQLRLYLKRSAPIESPTVRHVGLGFYMSLFQQMARADQMQRPFTFTMDFTGPGGGPWTFHVADGACTLEERRVAAADLVMTQTPETFVKTLAKMHNPMLAMLTRQVRVRGLRNMSTFAKLMPSPNDDNLSLPLNLEP
jgi:putative sterol carrier protein